jgi:thioredoxin 1
VSCQQRNALTLGLAMILILSEPLWAAAPAADRSPAPPEQNVIANATAAPTPRPLPKLLDLGADKCIPCKMMVPILDELEHTLAGRLEVEFIDVWKHPEQAKPYAIKIIPTQIFIDPSGKELYRHTGFLPRQEIISKWLEFGYHFDAAPTPQAPTAE